MHYVEMGWSVCVLCYLRCVSVIRMQFCTGCTHPAIWVLFDDSMRVVLLLLAACGARADQCPTWCSTWTCDGSAWCQHGATPAPCHDCTMVEASHGHFAAPEACHDCTVVSAPANPTPCPARCSAIAAGEEKPPECKTCGVAKVASAIGPVHVSRGGPSPGWVVDVARTTAPAVELPSGKLRIKGSSRLFLVQNKTHESWKGHKYVRFDMEDKPLEFEADLSGVPCGCLACVYLVAMPDPNEHDGSNYCDMAENVRPGFNGGPCTEIDIFEANNGAMQTAVHTELGGKYGSGNCDRNGCFARIGGPQAPKSKQDDYNFGLPTTGTSNYIQSSKPFKVHASVDSEGALTIKLSQSSHSTTSFSKSMAGNPQGEGVPAKSLRDMKAAQGKLALVASLWKASDLSWLDGPGCNACELSEASYTIQMLS